LPENILIAFGTRPEVIKCAPVISRFEENEHWNVTTLHTGQHTDLTETLVEFFGIDVDYNLNVMESGLSLDRLHARIMQRTADVIDDIQPDFILAQGDTLSVLCLAESAFFRKIPFIHLDAGLRTYDLTQPFPEEMHRQVVSRLTTIHLCSTQKALVDLQQEQLDLSHAHVVGNTVIDALLETAERVENSNESVFEDSDKTKLLITVHRRENHGQNLSDILNALHRISRDFEPEIEMVLPYHPNPNVKAKVQQKFKNRDNVKVIPPLEYPHMVKAMLDATFLVSDSGGIQEEAPTLGRPVLVLRNTTERPESVDAGVTRLIGTDEQKVYENIAELITNRGKLQAMSKKVFPYGRGDAAQKILAVMNEKNQRA